MANHIYRDSVTGRIVTAEYARDNPNTTTRELTEQETDSRGDLYHDAMTMTKVHDALKRAGITGVDTRENVISELQRVGILFRERGKF